jgi:hypothetical protein
MGVDIADDGQAARAARRPQGGEGGRVENADAGAVGLRIQLVVEDDVLDLAEFAGMRPARGGCRGYAAAAPV